MENQKALDLLQPLLDLELKTVPHATILPQTCHRYPRRRQTCRTRDFLRCAARKWV